MAETNYELAAGQAGERIAAPDLSWHPPVPKQARYRIALIGCGGISEMHLQGYRDAGFDVPVICSRSCERAEARRAAFYPEAEIETDFAAVLRRDDIDIVDLTAHPVERAPMIEAALRAGKHVLSQKPYVEDLNEGRRLADLARTQGLKLAVNQNGRWAPHFAYLREAVQAGVIGHVSSVRCAVHWDHNWIVDTAFNNVRHIILYDFAIHWFDFVSSVLHGREARRVTASVARSASQQAAPPLIAQAAIAFDDALVDLFFDADTKQGPLNQTTITGSEGALHSTGPDLAQQTVTGHVDGGWFSPELSGTWFPDGFRGAMGELMAAIEADREPLNGAAGNLTGLGWCFAAVQAAEQGLPVDPSQIERLPVA